MPIHFRCSTCERMLSIARRKAGLQVACPKCGTSVRVPAAAGVAVNSDPHASPNNLQALPLFERNDFEQLLNPAIRAANATVKEPPQAPPVAVSVEDSGEIEVMELDGVLITRSRMTVLAVAIAVLLALSFSLGFFIAAATVKR